MTRAFHFLIVEWGAILAEMDHLSAKDPVYRSHNRRFFAIPQSEIHHSVIMALQQPANQEVVSEHQNGTSGAL